MIRCKAKDPELNATLDKRESKQVNGGKRLRKEEAALPKPLDRAGAGGAQVRGRVAAPAGRVCGRAGQPLLMSKGRRWTGEEARPSGRWNNRRTTSWWSCWADR